MSEEELNVLSEREIEILCLVAEGLSNKEIARELFISANTVKVHLRNVFAKLEVSSRTEATMVAVRQGWVAVAGMAEEIALEPQPDQAVTEADGPLVEAVLPIAGWQRAFLLAVLLVALAALAWTWPRPASVKESLPDPLAENPGPVTLAELRSLPSRWREEVPLSIARGRLAVAATGGRVFAIGGEMPGGKVTGVVEVYDPGQRVWSLRASKPSPVANVSAVVLDGRIWVPGGLAFDGQVTTAVEVYDAASDTWSQAAPLPAPRAAYALAAHGGRLYLFGGTDGNQDVATVFVYDPGVDGWSVAADMPAARAFAAASTLGDAVYVVGGYAGGHELTTCEVYHPAEASWALCAPMLEGRGGFSLVAVGRNLFAIGGGWESYLAYNQQYDPLKDIWLRFETPVSGQWRNVGAAELNGSLYVVGGWSEQFLNINLAYQATYNVFLPLSPSSAGGDGGEP